MGHRRWMSPQALGATERLREAEKPHRLDEAANLHLASFQLEAEHRAKAGLLRFSDSMTRMRG
jgi:hypothetical protein